MRHPEPACVYCACSRAPMCWTVGLIETIAARFGYATQRTCRDGECALVRAEPPLAPAEAQAKPSV